MSEELVIVEGAPPPTGADIMPTFTAATTAGASITASEEPVSGREGWRAAADDGGTSYWQTTDNVCTWRFDGGAGAALWLASYIITPSNGSEVPTAWTLEGWNGSGYTTLDTRSGVSSGWSGGTPRAFTLGAIAGPFRGYRLNFTAGGSTRIEIAEIELIY